MAKILTVAELNSATWMKIEAHLNERISTHQKSLEQDKTEEATAKIRGRISEIRRLISNCKGSTIIAAIDKTKVSY